jgi:hypothetical protein
VFGKNSLMVMVCPQATGAMNKSSINRTSVFIWSSPKLIEGQPLWLNALSIPGREANPQITQIGLMSFCSA